MTNSWPATPFDRWRVCELEITTCDFKLGQVRAGTRVSASCVNDGRTGGFMINVALIMRCNTHP